MLNLSPWLGRVDNILTHTERGLARPVVILLADAHRHADEPEAGAALVHHTAPVVVVLSVDESIYDGLRGPAVSGLVEDRERGQMKGVYRKWKWGLVRVGGDRDGGEKDQVPKRSLFSHLPLRVAIQE